MGDKSNPVASVKYFYEPDGTLTARDVNGQHQKFEYDAKGQLTGVQNKIFGEKVFYG